VKIKANGIMMNYELTGDGRCLTLIHGAGDNSGVWYKQVPILSPHFQVLTYDIRGYGLTEFPEGNVSTQLWVEDLHALLKELSIPRTFLLGTSRGGLIALNFALTYPEKTMALILSNSSAAASLRKFPVSELQTRNQASIKAIEERGMAAVADRLIPMMFAPDFPEKDPATVARYKSIVMNNAPRKVIRVLQRTVPSEPPDLKRISCPVLIIGGLYDAEISPQGYEAIGVGIPNSKLVMFPAGHLAALEMPEEHAGAVIDFLSTVS